jgi:chitin disaccharide deacetylase
MAGDTLQPLLGPPTERPAVGFGTFGAAKDKAANVNDPSPATRPLRTLTLCAEGFGLDAGVSLAISRLARAGRVNAVSCATTAASWGPDSAWLADMPEQVQQGLHFNLTFGRPLSRRLARLWPQFPPLSRLVAQAHLGLLPRAALRAEFHAQLGAYVRATESPPDFIDSHEHVHHLPVVRGIMLDAVEHIQPMPAICSTWPVRGGGSELTRWLIAHFGGQALATELKRRVISHNPALLGVYDFKTTDYRGLMRRWLDALPDEGGLLCCHPGAVGSLGAGDRIGAARLRELDYLAGDSFTHDLAEAGVTLGTVWR